MVKSMHLPISSIVTVYLKQCTFHSPPFLPQTFHISTSFYKKNSHRSPLVSSTNLQCPCFTNVYHKHTASLAKWLRRPPREREVPGSNPASARIFSGSSHTSDLKIGTPVATLPGAWRYRVSTGTGRPGVSILWLGEMESLICNFYLSVAARKIVCADPSLRYTRMLLGR